MELDELKKSWNALNEQLQKEPIADEQQITEPVSYTHLAYQHKVCPVTFTDIAALVDAVNLCGSMAHFFNDGFECEYSPICSPKKKEVP